MSQEPSQFSPSVKFLHLLSAAIGLTALSFFLKNEIESENNAAMRALYSSFFLAASLLYSIASTTTKGQNRARRKAAAEAQKAEAQGQSTDQIQPPSPPSPTAISPMLATPRRDIAYSTPSKSDAKFPTGSSPEDLRQPSGSLYRSPSDSEFSPTPFSPAPNSRYSSVGHAGMEANGTPTFWSKLIYGLSYLQPVWSAASNTLFVQNILTESNIASPGDDFTMPYTILTGIGTGISDRVGSQDWSLFGIPRLIDSYLNTVGIAGEYFAGNLLRNYFFTQTIVDSILASLGTGWHTSKVNDKIINHVVSSSKSSQSRSKPDLGSALSNILTSLFGLGLMGASIGILKQVKEDPEQLRNFFCLLLACFGGYMAGYPLGKISASRIPFHYHKRALNMLMFVLTALATPKLTGPHYVLLGGAGTACGALEFILQSERRSHFAYMSARKIEIDHLLAQAPSELLNYLAQLELPKEDNGFVAEREKHKGAKKFFNGICIAYIGLLVLYPFFSDTTNKNTYWRSGISTVGMTLMLLSFNYLLPRYAPSIYSPERLSGVKKFLYQDSLHYMFLVIIAIRMGYDPSFTGTTAEIAVVAWFDLIVLPYLAAGAYKRLDGGYAPFRLTKDDMAHIKLNLEKLPKILHLLPADKQYPFKYHVAKFIQENCIKQAQDAAAKREVPVPLTPDISPSAAVIEVVSDTPPASSQPERRLSISVPKNDNKHSAGSFGSFFYIKHTEITRDDEVVTEEDSHQLDFIEARFNISGAESVGHAGVRGGPIMDGAIGPLHQFKI